jgi:hypothetical protein|tara:strand:+ start:343 stop:813 length:471 start_codon:yes stop_codon:yes gene_type:complete
MATVPGQRFAGKHDNVPAPIKVEPTVPASVSAHPEREKLWVFLVEDLRQRNLWSPTYEITLEQFVHVIFDLESMRQIVEEEGFQVTRYSSKGEPIGQQAHPLLSTIKSWRKDFLSFISLFGMSPKDIVFLSQTDPSAQQVIDVVVGERQKLNYFRD